MAGSGGSPSGEGMYDKAFEGLFNSKVFRSDMVIEEFNSIVKSMMQLSGMSMRFPDFDLEGKKLYLEQMGRCCERYEVFIKRLELGEDPGARQYLTTVNAQMLNGGFTMGQMFSGFKQTLEEYRKWVEQEERVVADPVKHQKFLQDFRAMWAQSALGRMDLSYLVQKSDPAIIMRAQQDPEFWVAIREISTSPTSETISKWLDHPNIGPLVGELWKSMMEKGMR